MSSELALEVENLGKCYRVFSNPRDRLLQSLIGARRQLYTPVWALQDVSFQLERGHTLGVVGRNGSGKSTLLQLICGTLNPSSGRVAVHGRVAALLELGSGFNPDFSGLENVYLNGALLGLSRSAVEARLDEILAFADIGAYVHQPVKTYSSGMALRLAFAVQAILDPEILIVDEALAVGDERFQKKCYAHLEKLRQQGTSILLVTHSCPTIVQQCDQALLLHRGQALLMGAPKVVTTVYQRMSGGAEAEWTDKLAALARRLQQEAETELENGVEEPSTQEEQHPGLEASHDPSLTPFSRVVYPDRGARIEDLCILSSQGKVCNLIPQGDQFEIRLRCFVEQSLQEIRINCFLTNASGVRISGQLWPASAPFYGTLDRGEELELRFRFEARLAAGTYFVTAGIKQRLGERYVHRIVDAAMLRILSDGARRTVGFVDLQAAEPELHRRRDAQNAE
jgi:lipopolysaccharide transport system ATP-binding protein